MLICGIVVVLPPPLISHYSQLNLPKVLRGRIIYTNLRRKTAANPSDFAYPFRFIIRQTILNSFIRFLPNNAPNKLMRHAPDLKSQNKKLMSCRFALNYFSRPKNQLFATKRAYSRRTFAFRRHKNTTQTKSPTASFAWDKTTQNFGQKLKRVPLLY